MVHPTTLISSVQGPRTISCLGKYNLMNQNKERLLMPASACPEINQLNPHTLELVHISTYRIQRAGI